MNEILKIDVTLKNLITSYNNTFKLSEDESIVPPREIYSDVEFAEVEYHKQFKAVVIEKVAKEN